MGYGLGKLPCTPSFSCANRPPLIPHVRLAEFGVLNPLVTAWLSIQVGVDILVTGKPLHPRRPPVLLTLYYAVGVLSYVLFKLRTGFRQTDTVLKRLIRGAIQTGVFASIFSLGDLISFLGAPKTFLYGMFAVRFFCAKSFPPPDSGNHPGLHWAG